MAITKFTSLDFEQIKETLKSYLRSNSTFSDYDFEGSTLSTVIDLLAYNTYIAAYNANMLSNEVFIDGATLRENVVSLARNVGYLPRTKTSAKANISFFVDTSDLSSAPRSITLNKGSVAINRTNNTNTSRTFCIPEAVTATVFQDSATFDNVTIYEGSLIESTFTVDSNQTNQRYILDNVGIDYSTIRVTVKDDFFSDDFVVYRMASSISELTPTSKVFFIQEIEDERYELIFGDGVFGNKLQDSNLITVSYIVTNGESGNGPSNFTFLGSLVDNNGNVIARNVSEIAVLSPASGGADIESVQSIKNYAGRTYASQGRAVTSNDYETIVRRVYPETDSINAFGGEELDPPRYGRVFITIKPKTGLYVSNALKDSIKRELRKYSVAGIVPEILDTKFLFVECRTNVYYNPSLTKSSENVNQAVSLTLTKFAASEEMNMYGSRFRYTQFTSLIDKSDRSITSNITEIRIRRDMRAVVNRLAEYEVCFGNSFKILDRTGYNIKSSGFSVAGINGLVYFSDIPGSDNMGELVLIQVPDAIELPYGGTEDQPKPSATIVRRNVGKIDYAKGEINISAINITSTEIPLNSTIEISATPLSNDVIGLQDLFLQFDTGSSGINVIEDNILSGSDPTGSRFIVTPTNYSNSVIRPRS